MCVRRIAVTIGDDWRGGYTSTISIRVEVLVTDKTFIITGLLERSTVRFGERFAFVNSVFCNKTVTRVTRFTRTFINEFETVKCSYLFTSVVREEVCAETRRASRFVRVIVTETNLLISRNGNT